ncbi:MAG: DUF4157 domain-containing protein [Pseudomonadota bacterium]|nr:DUF4157 domain-containing protein [Pseudomonadota bacterium]
MASNGSPKTSRSARGVSRTSDRLASRASRGIGGQGGDLQRSAMPGGGEVFGGELASRALKTLGARAMTVDKSIIVADDFNPGRVEDQALFAHEQFHVEHSGGQGSHEARDGEEVAARSVERMVLHRNRSGGAESHEAGHAVPSTASTSAAGGGSQKREGQETEANAQRGYEALVAEGLGREAILERFAREVLQSIEHSRDAALDRFADKKGFL